MCWTSFCGLIWHDVPWCSPWCCPWSSKLLLILMGVWPIKVKILSHSSKEMKQFRTFFFLAKKQKREKIIHSHFFFWTLEGQHNLELELNLPCSLLVVVWWTPSKSYGCPREIKVVTVKRREKNLSTGFHPHRVLKRHGVLNQCFHKLYPKLLKAYSFAVAREPKDRASCSDS